MGRSVITEAEIIQMTSEMVRSFYHRKLETTTGYMSDDFMWIGANDFQWCEGLEEFYRVTQKEYQEPNVLLSNEEYHLLFHERNVWVVYGRYHATVILEDGSVIHAHVRGTYVWRRVNGIVKLAHVHGSNAQDIPLNQLVPSAQPLTSDTDYFKYISRMDHLKMEDQKLLFRDRDKKHRYLLPSEILYLQAALQWTTVYTMDGSFQTWGLLAEHEQNMPSMFIRIHKSYMVNSMYIDTICRYKAVLKNGQNIPIGKDRYMKLKQFLAKDSSGNGKT